MTSTPSPRRAATPEDSPPPDAAPATGAESLPPDARPATGKASLPPAEVSASGTAGAAARLPMARGSWKAALDRGLRSGSLLAQIPWIVLAILILLYASRQTGVFSLNELNIITGETLALILVAFGQTVVIVSGGIDLSIGGIVSLVSVLAALHFGNGGATMWFWMAGLILGSTAAGAANGLLIALTRMQPFIVTLATWSIFGGIALWALPTTGGSVPADWMSVGNGVWLGLSSAVWILLALVLAWHVFKRTRLWFAIRSVGSSQEAAFLSGVPVPRTITSVYAISGLFGALAGLFYITQAASGSPTAGNDYILPSVVAVVIGGTSVAGGRGGFGGTVAGAYILTLIGSVIFIFGIDGHLQAVFEGLLLIVTVLINVLAGYLVRRRSAR